MKKTILLIGLFLISAVAASAQLREVLMDYNGTPTYIVEVDRGQYVAMSEYGTILDAEISGRVEYYDRNDTRDRSLIGQVKRIGRVKFEYITHTAFDHMRGKISRIGRVKFEYVEVTIHNEIKGKLERIGNEQIRYYDFFTSDESGRAGKVNNIGSIRFDFFKNGDARWDRSPAAYRKVGLVSVIDRYQFEYHNDRPSYDGYGRYDRYPAGDRQRPLIFGRSTGMRQEAQPGRGDDRGNDRSNDRGYDRADERSGASERHGRPGAQNRPGVGAQRPPAYGYSHFVNGLRVDGPMEIYNPRSKVYVTMVESEVYRHFNDSYPSYYEGRHPNRDPDRGRPIPNNRPR